MTATLMRASDPFLRTDFAARHPAYIDMCPSAGAHGTGHVIYDAMVSIPTRASTVLQSAVLAFASFSSPKVGGTGSSWVFFLFCDLLSTELCLSLMGAQHLALVCKCRSGTRRGRTATAGLWRSPMATNALSNGKCMTGTNGRVLFRKGAWCWRSDSSALRH